MSSTSDFETGELSSEMTSLNDIVAEYDDSPFDRAMRHWMMRSLEPYFSSGSALELGCLYGEFTALLAQRFERLVVVDAADRFLEITRSRVEGNVEFVRSLFETFETDERFDAIFLMHVLEHLIDPVAVLRRTAELLKPGGAIFAVVPNGNAISRQIAVEMGLLNSICDFTPADERARHRRVYVSDTFRRDVRAAGLDIRASGGVFFKPLANFQFDGLLGGPYISHEFMEACYRLGERYPDLCASLYLVCGRSDE